MKIIYDNKKIESYFNDFGFMLKKVGPEITKSLKKRLEHLKAAESFGDFLQTRLGNPHLLKGNIAGYYGITITKNIRLIVKPNTDDLSADSLKKCKEVIIKGVKDYHGQKITSYIP